jgi:4-hydroxybenzoate polyprenyltransferase
VSRRAQENVLAAVIAVIFVGYLLIATGFGPNARLVPLPIAGLGLLCLLIQIVRQNRQGGLEQNTFGPLSLLIGDRAPEAEPKPEPDASSQPAEPTSTRELKAFGFVGLFVALIVALGPVPAVFLFCAGYLAVSKHYPAWKAIASAAAFAATVYLLFVVGLELQLYHGLLEPIVDRF